MCLTIKLAAQKSTILKFTFAKSAFYYYYKKNDFERILSTQSTIKKKGVGLKYQS